MYFCLYLYEVTVDNQLTHPVMSCKYAAKRVNFGVYKTRNSFKAVKSTLNKFHNVRGTLIIDLISSVDGLIHSYLINISFDDDTTSLGIVP